MASVQDPTATITAGPDLLLDTCPQCLVVAGGYGDLSQVYWINRTASFTLDTISIVVTQYNGSAVTGTTTKLGDISSLNISFASQAIRDSEDPFMAEVMMSWQIYSGSGGGYRILLANGRDGKINDALSIPYPSPYIGFDEVAYYTVIPQGQNISASTFNNGFWRNNHDCGCEVDYGDCPLRDGAFSIPRFPGPVMTTTISFSRPYYEVLTNLARPQDMVSVLNSGSLSSWMVSDKSIISQYPNISACVFFNMAYGPPAIKVPVSALTATTTMTVKGHVGSTSKLAKPADTVVTTSASQTSSPPLLMPTLPSVKPHLAPIWQLSDHSKTSTQESQDSVVGDSPAMSDPSQKTSTQVEPEQSTIPPLPGPRVSQHIQSSESVPDGATASTSRGSTSQVDNQAKVTTTSGPNGLSNIESDLTNTYPYVSSYPNSPGVEIKSSATTPLTDSVSLPSVASTAVGEDGSVITACTLSSPNTDVSNSKSPDTMPVSSSDDLAMPASEATTTYTPQITFIDQTYTADSASNIRIGSQTLTPGGPAITVSGTSLSLAPSASLVVIEKSTVALNSSPGLPKITIGEETIAPNSASEFLLSGQTLAPGGPAVTVSGTLLSLAPSASLVVIGESTVTLNSVPGLPTLTIGGSTIIANSASEYIVSSHTLTPGGAITVNGTQISVAATGTDVVVGSSTEATNLGSIIMGGFDAPSQTTAETFTGGSTSWRRVSGRHLVVIGVAIVGMIYQSVVWNLGTND